MKALVGAFNQEKALVGAFSVIVQLHRLIDLRHYLRVLPDGDGCLGGEEEALDVGVPNAVVHKLVGPDPLHRREQIVGAGCSGRA